MQALYNEGVGDDDLIQVAPTPAEKAKAEQRIKKLRRSLTRWLKKRRVNDQAAMGLIKAKVPVSVLAKSLPLERDWNTEQRLAFRLHTLLSEVMDAASLPDPDISKDPNAAARLAEIVISGKLPAEARGPSSQGLLPLLFIWPVVIVIGMVMFSSMAKAENDADLLTLKEENRCKETGACTDEGFWLKWGAIAVVGWIAWDKFGLKEKFKK
jgi:hypothetical protein